MQARCIGDALLTKAVWQVLQPDGYSQDALALRPVEIHREFITAAARWMMAAKL
jgi:hypothetical protein